MSDELMKRIDSFIEYATSTKKYHDAGFYQEVKDEIIKLREELASFSYVGKTACEMDTIFAELDMNTEFDVGVDIFVKLERK